jgi:hypothetical protein
MARSLHWAALSGLFAVALLSTLPGACRLVADIPSGDPYVDASPGGWDGSAPVSPLCKEYCEAMQQNCTESSQTYANLTVCTNVCGILPAGKNTDTSGNTVHCRLQAAMSGEPEDCQTSSPMSNGTCGSHCENYCYLLKRLCPGSFENDATCEAECAQISDIGNFTVMPEDEGNTLQCRFYHLTSAALNPQVHCPHALGKFTCPRQDKTEPDASAPDAPP